MPLVSVVLLVCTKNSKNCDQSISQFLEMKLLQIVLSFHSLGIAKIRLYNIFQGKKCKSKYPQESCLLGIVIVIISKMY